MASCAYRTSRRCSGRCERSTRRRIFATPVKPARMGTKAGPVRCGVLVARRFQIRTYAAHARWVSATEAEVRLVPKLLDVPRGIASRRKAVGPVVDRRSIRIRCAAIISISLRKSRGSDRGGQNYHRAEQFHSHLHSPRTTQINRSVLTPVPELPIDFE